MLVIIDGSLADSREEMKELRLIVQTRLSKFRKSIKKENRTKQQLKTIESREDWLDYFKVSQMAPVFIEDICINYKLYERFLKKLKGYHITEKVEEGRLVVSYQKGAAKGELTLYDISQRLDGLNFFPRAVIKDD